MIVADLGVDVPLQLVLSDGATGLFPQVTIYNSAGAVAGTVNLSHTANGLYQGTFLAADNTAVGKFSVLFIIYSDVGHTLVDETYDRVDEDLDVTVGGKAAGG